MYEKRRKYDWTIINCWSTIKQKASFDNRQNSS